MPVNDIVATLQPRADPVESKDLPEDDGRPDPDEQKETTLRTPRMMPPYIHNQTIGDRSMWELAGVVIGLYGLLKKVN